MPPSNTNTEIALMKKDIEYIKQSMLEQKELMKDFIASSKDTFATKEEHKANEKAIEEIRSAHTKIAWSALSFI